MLFKKKRYPRICMVCTAFSLFEYLMYSSYEEIKKTFFIIEDWMYPDFGYKLNHVYRMPAWKHSFWWNQNLIWIRWYFIKWFKLPNFKKTELFTLDHLPYHAVFIGRHRYTLLEDGPYCHSVMYKDNVHFSYAEEKELQHLTSKKRILLHRFRQVVYGPVYFNRWGKNEVCSDIILSTDDYLYYFRKKNIHRFNLKGIWQTFSIEKKNFILKVFDMTPGDIEMLMSKKIIIFTQALYPDYISIEEHGRIWKDIISRYPIEQILLKPHPRDLYEYEKEIEGLTIFRKKVPSQFFEVLDLRFLKAVTAYSSSVFHLSVDEIDWYGTQVHKTISERVGLVPFIPEGLKVNKCYL